ncbi:hypothetical protein KUTeg_023329 [Tegillarca granosa]|uniref:Uncharacterized protein n=1 Tax=Tegillarca granosa TaxID=220873 RepID=A0ABQ9E1B8_TEGGR|nr:hypothetical protein KUTeg_023329 [Tegillarca granosa]
MFEVNILPRTSDLNQKSRLKEASGSKIIYWEMATYGVVVVFSACMIQVLTFGIATSIGLYNIELLEYYGSSTAETSMIGSINIGVFLGAGTQT